MSWFTIAWGLWALAFAVIEGIGLANKKKGDTLSEHVWKIFKVRESKAWTFGRFFLAAFMVWLSGHFVFGWWS